MGGGGGAPTPGRDATATPRHSFRGAASRVHTSGQGVHTSECSGQRERTRRRRPRGATGEPSRVGRAHVGRYRASLRSQCPGWRRGGATAAQPACSDLSAVAEALSAEALSTSASPRGSGAQYGATLDDDDDDTSAEARPPRCPLTGRARRRRAHASARTPGNRYRYGIGGWGVGGWGVGGWGVGGGQVDIPDTGGGHELAAP